MHLALLVPTLAQTIAGGTVILGTIGALVLVVLIVGILLALMSSYNSSH